MTDRLERVRDWLRDLGAPGAVANARSELERRAVEHAMLEALALRVPADPTARDAAA